MELEALMFEPRLVTQRVAQSLSNTQSVCEVGAAKSRVLSIRIKESERREEGGVEDSRAS